jgi:hypothetical protein
MGLLANKANTQINKSQCHREWGWDNTVMRVLAFLKVRIHIKQPQDLRGWGWDSKVMGLPAFLKARVYLKWVRRAC